MNTNRREDLRMLLGNLYGAVVGLDRTNRADRDDLRDFRIGGAFQHTVEVGLDALVRQVAVRVDDRNHRRASAGYALGFSIRGNSGTGAFTRCPGLMPCPYGARAVAASTASNSSKRCEV